MDAGSGGAGDGCISSSDAFANALNPYPPPSSVYRIYRGFSAGAGGGSRSSAGSSRTRGRSYPALPLPRVPGAGEGEGEGREAGE